MEWLVDEVPTTAHTSFNDIDVFGLNGTEMKNLKNGEDRIKQNDQKFKN
jgi:hypothetical protein